VCAGALDELGPNRATLMNAIPDAVQLAERAAFAQAAGQGALFGGDETEAELTHVFTPLSDWTKRERLDAESEALGLHLTGHLFDDYASHCARLGIRSIEQIVASLPSDENSRYTVRQRATTAGVVMAVQRRGNRVTLQLDDRKGRIEATLFDEVYNGAKHLIRKDAILVVDGQLRWDDFSSAWRLNAQSVRSVDDAIEEHALRITISLNGEAGANGEFIGRLKDALEPFRRGNCQVALKYHGPEADAELTFGEDWCVRPTRELRDRLTRLLGEERYQIHYPRHINGPSL
jgi:DNA polymerase-3 subunit alpha